jgi:hypothetical protein
VTRRRPPWHRESVTSLPCTTPRATAAVLGVALTASLLAGCGGGDETPGEVVVTVTAGASDSPSESPSETASEKSEPAPAETVKSDDVGRKFDFGIVKSVDTDGGTQVLVFDRWTDPKVDDTVLAQKGLDVEPYDLDRSPFENINTTNTFRVPVREGTTFLLHHCVQKGEPVTSKSVSAEELAAADRADALILLDIDPKTGYTTGGETFAGC